jgi:Arc/MetJ-type ribon-helix-helix transcriptional regulator
MKVTIELSDALAEFVRMQVVTGSHASEADVIERAVSAYADLEVSGQDIETLRLSWLDGLNSPLEGDFDPGAILQDVRRERAKLAG